MPSIHKHSLYIKWRWNKDIRKHVLFTQERRQDYWLRCRNTAKKKINKKTTHSPDSQSAALRKQLRNQHLGEIHTVHGPRKDRLRIEEFRLCLFILFSSSPPLRLSRYWPPFRFGKTLSTSRPFHRGVKVTIGPFCVCGIVK